MMALRLAAYRGTAGGPWPSRQSQLTQVLLTQWKAL